MSVHVRPIGTLQRKQQLNQEESGKDESYLVVLTDICLNVQRICSAVS